MSSRLPATIHPSAAAENVADELAFLVTINDDSLDAPLRYTTTAKTRLSTDPLRYGIVSAGLTFTYALVSALLPDESNDNSQATEIVIDNVAENSAPSIRELSADATVDVALILTSLPDVQFAAVNDLFIVNRTYALETVTIEVSRHANRPGAPDALEPLSGERQTRFKAPGLHR